MNKGILILTPFFSTNIGGVETHFDDLVEALDDNGYKVYVQTYSPITTANVEWKSKEKKGNNKSYMQEMALPMPSNPVGYWMLCAKTAEVEANLFI